MKLSKLDDLQLLAAYMRVRREAEKVIGTPGQILSDKERSRFHEVESAAVARGLLSENPRRATA